MRVEGIVELHICWKRKEGFEPFDVCSVLTNQYPTKCKGFKNLVNDLLNHVVSQWQLHLVCY